MTDHNRRTDDQHRQITAQYQRTFDPATDSVSDELVKTVSDFTNADISELPVLARSVDPEALDALFEPRLDGTPRDTTGEIRFQYGEYTVHVESEGTITLHQDGWFPER